MTMTVVQGFSPDQASVQELVGSKKSSTSSQDCQQTEVLIRKYDVLLVIHEEWFDPCRSRTVVFESMEASDEDEKVDSTS